MTVHYQRALTRNLYVRDHKVINRSSAGSIMEFQNKSEFVMGLFGQNYSWILDKIIQIIQSITMSTGAGVEVFVS